MGQPGQVVIFGSGEAATSSRKVHERLLAQLHGRVEIALLETPAGFQPNVDTVSAKIQDYLEHHLQNYKPHVTRVRARRKGTPDDPNAAEVVAPLLAANYIIAGPGSPTYAIRQLRDSLAMTYLARRHREGATIALASAAAIAMSAYALPVYEIFKVGEDLGWARGLDLFGADGLDVAILPHWNNREGGKDLDTSHCFVGMERFTRLQAMLPRTTNVLGVDEHTSCIVDVAEAQCHVMGLGTITIMNADGEATHIAGESFSLSELR